jgi:hypothetical protein
LINVKFKLQTCSACQDLPTMQFWSISHNPFWSYFPFSIFTHYYHSILTTLVLCEMIWSCSCVFHMRVKCWPSHSWLFIGWTSCDIEIVLSTSICVNNTNNINKTWNLYKTNGCKDEHGFLHGNGSWDHKIGLKMWRHVIWQHVITYCCIEYTSPELMAQIVKA